MDGALRTFFGALKSLLRGLNVARWAALVVFILVVALAVLLFFFPDWTPYVVAGILIVMALPMLALFALLSLPFRAKSVVRLIRMGYPDNVKEMTVRVWARKLHEESIESERLLAETAFNEARKVYRIYKDRVRRLKKDWDDQGDDDAPDKPGGSAGGASGGTGAPGGGGAAASSPGGPAASERGPTPPGGAAVPPPRAERDAGASGVQHPGPPPKRAAQRHASEAPGIRFAAGPSTRPPSDRPAPSATTAPRPPGGRPTMPGTQPTAPRLPPTEPGSGPASPASDPARGGRPGGTRGGDDREADPRRKDPKRPPGA